jgi:hypothetical protein
VDKNADADPDAASPFPELALFFGWLLRRALVFRFPLGFNKDGSILMVRDSEDEEDMFIFLFLFFF